MLKSSVSIVPSSRSLAPHRAPFHRLRGSGALVPGLKIYYFEREVMYTFLFILFMIVSLLLSLLVLIQQGKGDLGISSMSGSQMLFGGSGGQTFFERITWFLGALFMIGALGLSVLKTKEQRISILDNVVLPRKNPTLPAQAKNISIEEPAEQQDDTTSDEA